jgi:cation diffusion facilitator CzcD-associated flavoprotein CzcO
MKRQNIDRNKTTETALREHPVLIIGAGHNGLAAAYELKKIGVNPVILEAASQPAASWRGRHDQLRLNTHRLISFLPGMRIPRGCGAFPSRDDMVQYLEAYERFLDVAIHRQVRVERIDRQSTGWRLTTSKGIWLTRNLIIATGLESLPHIPDWPGRNEFTGELIHAAQFGRVDRFKHKRILVVGAGNSGTDVLNHLVRIDTDSLWVSVRNGPAILPTRILGFPLQLLSPLMVPLPAWTVDLLMSTTQWMRFGNVKKHNLSKHPDGVATRLIREGVAPAFDDGFMAALKKGRVTVLPEIERFEGDIVKLRGGQTIRPDTVICATGYSPGLEPLVGHLGVLDEAGKPFDDGHQADAGLEGLWCMGMTPRLPGVFYSARSEARRIAGEIQKRKALSRHRPVNRSPAYTLAP